MKWRFFFSAMAFLFLALCIGVLCLGIYNNTRDVALQGIASLGWIPALILLKLGLNALVYLPVKRGWAELAQTQDLKYERRAMRYPRLTGTFAGHEASITFFASKPGGPIYGGASIEGLVGTGLGTWLGGLAGAKYFTLVQVEGGPTVPADLWIEFLHPGSTTETAFKVGVQSIDDRFAVTGDDEAKTRALLSKPETVRRLQDLLRTQPAELSVQQRTCRAVFAGVLVRASEIEAILRSMTRALEGLAAK